MAVLKAINVLLSFLLEIGMLAAFAYWGFHAVENPWLRWVVAIGLPLVVVILWGLFLAPRAGQRTNSTVGVAVSLGLFCLAGLMLIGANQMALGVAMLLLAGINRTFVVLWKQW